MKKLNNKKGFTLAELLIVVAIIAVLVAISIPIFSAQLEKAREATDLANVRSAYAEVIANYLTEEKSDTITVDARQTKPKWQTDSSNSTTHIGTDIGGDGEVSVPAHVAGSQYTVTINSSGTVTIS